MIHYELCEELWEGSYATDQIVGGIETNELPQDSQSFSSSDFENQWRIWLTCVEQFAVLLNQ